MPKKKKVKKKSSVRRKLAAVAAGTVLLVTGTVGVVKRRISPGETVQSVIDGDSFKIGKDQTIRLLGLDAPDIKYCMGEEAKDVLSKMVLGKRVILTELKTDPYGRVMAMVYTDGKNVNEFMIKNGLALNRFANSSQKEILNAANDFARENRLGIFSPECYQTEPPNSKCSIKGNIIHDTKAMEYIMPDCNHYSLAVVEKYKGETDSEHFQKIRQQEGIESANREYIEHRTQRLALSPKERAKFTGRFELLWNSMTNRKNILPHIMDEVRRIQEKFFERKQSILQ